MKEQLRILIVDDSPEDTALLTRWLQQEFSPVVHERVQNARDMRDALARESWQLVISDYFMPHFSGLSALQVLQHSGRDLPLIMISGQGGEDLAVEAMRAGAADFLVKGNLSRLIPAVRRELKEAVERRERRVAEEALRATEARFQSLVEQSLVGIFMLRQDRFSYVNPKFAQIFGYRQDELIDRKGLLDLVAADDQMGVMLHFLRPLNQKTQSAHLFFRGRRMDQQLIELEAHGTRTRHNGDEAIIGTLLDITDRKRAEEQLSKLSAAVEQSPVAVVITDAKGNIEYVNPKFTEFTGYGEAEVLGQNPRILKSGEMSDAFYRQMWHTISTGNDWHGEFHNRKKSGELYWESASISAVKNGEGRITHFVGVKEEVTERKREVDRVRQAQKMEAIGQLAGGVAHDFNNLLTIINGYSTLLVKELTAGTLMYREAEQILRAGERAADLTRQLLSFSRRQIVEPRILNINDQVRSVEKMLRRLIGEHIELVTALSDDLGLVKLDPGQVEQVIMNLVVNARDASETGGLITIETGNSELDKAFALSHPGAYPGRYVRLAVKDRGFGMSDEVKRRLFEPFFTTKEMGRGTGLGLATVYGIVKQGGGYIEVISQPEQGATFNIYFPRVFEDPQEVDEGSADDDLDGDQTILVVEDEPGVLHLVVQTLQQRGFTVLETTDPLQGVTIFEENADDIDLLLTDVVMPFMSGPKLASLLQEKNPQLKVLFMSGHTDDKIGFEKVLEQGAPFLPKPFGSDGLIAKVKQTLGESLPSVPERHLSGGST